MRPTTKNIPETLEYHYHLTCPLLDALKKCRGSEPMTGSNLT